MTHADDIDFAHRRILIVEDDYFIADEMARSLHSFGAQILGPAGTIETALELLNNNDTIDLAVLDINMRGRLVYPLADVLHERGVPFVFATGYDVQTIPDSYTSVPYLPKPADPVTVAVRLNKLLCTLNDDGGAEFDRLRFQIRSGAKGWGWKLQSGDGKVLAVGTADSSVGARANVFRAAQSRRRL